VGLKGFAAVAAKARERLGIACVAKIHPQGVEQGTLEVPHAAVVDQDFALEGSQPLLRRGVIEEAPRAWAETLDRRRIDEHRFHEQAR
jgi:hypothetical protein